MRWKCAAIVVMSLVPRGPREVTSPLSSSVAVLVSSNGHVCACVRACVSSMTSLPSCKKKSGGKCGAILADYIEMESAD